MHGLGTQIVFYELGMYSNVQRFFNCHITDVVETFIKRNMEFAWLIDDAEAYSRPIYL